jgi:hypothetical protein
VSQSIRETVTTHVDEEGKVAQEVCPEDGVFDVSDNKHPPERAAESIQRKGSFPVCPDGSVVNSL